MTQREELQEKISTMLEEHGLRERFDFTQEGVVNDLLALFLAEWEKLIPEKPAIDEEYIKGLEKTIGDKKNFTYRNLDENFVAGASSVIDQLRTTLNQLEAEKKGKYE